MAPYSIGGSVYNAVGTPASQANTANNPNGIVSTGAPDASSFHPLCPLDNLPCRVIGSQENCWRCDAGHQWSLGLNGLYYHPVILIGNLSPVVPTTIPPTLG